MKRETMVLPSILLAVLAKQSPNWTPPETTLPKEFVESVKFMLSHGFADPRGGTFSIATIKTSNIWNVDLRDTRVRGWILPSKSGQPQTIVLPTGLSYPVVSVIRGAEINEGLFESQPGNEISTNDFYYKGYPGCACLLLTGNTTISERQFPQNKVNPLPNTFMGIAYEYLNRRFHRAVEAHMRGDDILAHSDSLALQKDYPEYEKEAKRLLGVKYFENLARPDLGGDGRPTAFRSLKQIDDLVEDSTRRLKNPKLRQNLEAVMKLPTAQRIKKLIDMLDQVSVRQFSQPGGVPLSADPIVQAIVKIGNAAGPRLIDAIESDKRLTRSVSFGRDFGPDRNLITVRKAALVALQTISGTDDFQGDGKPLDTAKLRIYWEKYGSMTPSQRWLATLADDSKSPSQWLAAAESIVDDRVYVTVAGGITGYRSGVSGPMRGESLRNQKNPSVFELMEKRARMLFRASKQNSSDSARPPLRMCVALARWNAKSSVNCLRDVTREIMEYALKDKNSSFTFDYRGENIADVIDIRHQLGDADALPDYARFLTQTSHHSLTPENYMGLKLLVKYRTNPACEMAISELFVKEGAAWNLKENLIIKGSHIQVKSMLASPLIALKPFRDVALDLLADRTIIGKVRREGTTIFVQSERSNNTSGISDTDLNDPSICIDGDSMPYRICDQLAERFNSFGWASAPKVRLYWTISARDKAISDLSQYINDNGPKVMEELKPPYNWEFYSRVVLPPL